LLAIWALASAAEHIIMSDRTTDWGVWGSMQRCPPNTFVTSFSQKVEPDQGLFVDDSAQNALELNCAPLSNPTNVTASITSSMGPYGNWGSLYTCTPFFGIGFNLKVEANQQAGDDTATNTARLVCSDGSRVDAAGGRWGLWRTPAHCESQHAICGIQTQIELGISDETALNNVNLLCCPLPNLALTCEPKESYRIVNICDNSKSKVESTCEFEFEVGVGYVPGSAAAGWEGAGFTLEDAVKDLPETFRSHGKYSGDFSQSVFVKKGAVKRGVTVPAGTKTTISYLTAECAHYSVTTRKIKREDITAGNVVTSIHFNI